LKLALKISLQQRFRHSLAMNSYPPRFKQLAVLAYDPHDAQHSYAAVARRFHVRGGASAISRWHKRYDGTLKSLADRPRSGRPRILSVAQVKTSIIDAVRSYRRKHRCVSYATLLPADGSLAVPPNGAEKRQDNWTHQKQANKEANEE
jgi:plasmid stabilization system protein ParE